MKRIHESRVLNDGWEMDNALWIDEDKNGHRLMYTTSHGSEYVMDKEEFFEKIEETELSLAGLKAAAALMGYVSGGK